MSKKVGETGKDISKKIFHEAQNTTITGIIKKVSKRETKRLGFVASCNACRLVYVAGAKVLYVNGSFNCNKCGKPLEGVHGDFRAVRGWKRVR